MPGFEERFWAKVDRRGLLECWPWKAGVHTKGYGQFEHQMAHRVAYELLVGPIPEGLTLDHLCRNRTCVNPAHLEPVTSGENVLRGIGHTAINARKTHCDKGHRYDEANTYIDPKHGWRQCRECKAARQRLRPGGLTQDQRNRYNAARRARRVEIGTVMPVRTT